jgi:hypothetical protein
MFVKILGRPRTWNDELPRRVGSWLPVYAATCT